MARLGIDYGTTNTVVVCSDRGGFPVVPHLTDTTAGVVAREVFPSLAVFDRDRNGFLFGADAERAAARPGDAERYAIIPGPKRLVRDYVQGLRVRHDILPEGIDPAELLGGFARALGRSIRRSGLFAERDALEAVITWPANANGAQRHLTRRCFQDAGFEVVDTLNEPAAGAIEYADRVARGRRPEARQVSQSVLVFDLGGGTFDAALVRIDRDRFTVLDSGGIEHLGGDDFDERLARRFAGALKQDYEGLRPFQRALLLAAARRQKESISEGAASLTLTAGDAGMPGGVCTVPAATYLTELTPLIEPAVEKLLEIAGGERATEAGLGPGRVDAIYLVGGSSKLPLVPKLIRRRFPGTRLILSDKPFTSTAMGAAIHAAEGVRLQDLLARMFGIMRPAENGARERFEPIFAAGTALPVRGGPALRFEADYSPRHNIGRLRYLECAGLDGSGRPAGGVRPWSDVLFPYDPAIPLERRLTAEQIVGRGDLADKWVRETYSVDSDGVITVSIKRWCDGHTRTYEIFRN
jgi:molecular chaperone DnaK (HSP70)